MIKLKACNEDIPVEWIKFSDGAVTCVIESLPPIGRPDRLEFHVDPSTPSAQVTHELGLMIEAIEYELGGGKFPVKYILHLPYLPYGRAERRFSTGIQPIPLDVFINELSLQGHSEVHIMDPHNLESVTGTSVNFIITDQTECFKAAFPHIIDTDFDVVIAPDDGAKHKSADIAGLLVLPILYAGKRRDPATGRIVEFTVPDYEYNGLHILIPDDIIDGGGTFAGLATELKKRGAGKITLYATHMIGSNGLELFEQTIDQLVCVNYVGTSTTENDVKLFNKNSEMRQTFNSLMGTSADDIASTFGSYKFLELLHEESEYESDKWKLCYFSHELVTEGYDSEGYYYDDLYPCANTCLIYFFRLTNKDTGRSYELMVGFDVNSPARLENPSLINVMVSI